MSACRITQQPKPGQMPSVVPEPAIDLTQLGRLAQHDPGIMQELLRLFDLESGILLARIWREAPRTAAARAHTLAVSARAIGAWKMAEAATEFERLATQCGPVALGSAVRELARAATQTQTEIQRLISQSAERALACECMIPKSGYRFSERTVHGHEAKT
jgi:hypothetical protein